MKIIEGQYSKNIFDFDFFIDNKQIRKVYHF